MAEEACGEQLSYEESREFKHDRDNLEGIYDQITCELSIREGKKCLCTNWGSKKNGLPHECGASTYGKVMQFSNNGKIHVKPCCPKHLPYVCKDSKLCLPKSYKCDFDNDCGDWQDEHDNCVFGLTFNVSSSSNGQRRDIDCYTGTGKNYAGKETKTKKGYTCQNWHVGKPHKPNHKYLRAGPKNHCRNPSAVKRPWCYTTNKNKRWDYCKVPKCIDQYSMDMLRTYVVLEYILVSEYLSIYSINSTNLILNC